MIQRQWWGDRIGWMGVAAAAVLAATDPAAATPYSYTTSGAIYTQNFDTLPSTGNFSPSGSGPLDLDATPVNATGTDGWQYWRYAGSGTNAVFQVNAGAGNSGATYSYGAVNSTDRALGVLASGSGAYRIGMVLQNNTGTTLTSFTLGYLGEQWRYGGSTAENRLTFDYSIGSGTAINSTGAFTPVAGLDFVRPVASGTSGALDGNLAANQRSISGTVAGLAWAPGQYLVIRWSDVDNAGSDDGLAIDDLSFSAAGAAAGSNLYWSGATPWSETAPGAGGSGTWADGTGGWDSTKTANFAGPGGTVTIAGTATAAAGLTFSAAGYTVTGGTLTLSGADRLLTVDDGVSATIDSAVAGTDGLTKAGLGTLVLGGANTLTGGLRIGAGTVSVAAGDALGAASNTITFTGGRLRSTASVDVGGRTLSGGAILDIAPGTTLTTSATAALSGLTLTNTGTLALAGFGNTSGNISATAGSGTARVEGGLDLGTTGRTVTVASGGTLEIAGSLTGSGIMDKAGAGRLVLAGDNSALARIRIGTQGATPVSGGTVVAASETALGSDPVFFNNGTIEATQALSFANGLSIGGRATGPSRLAGSPMIFAGNIGTFAASGATGDIRLAVDNDTTFAGDFTATGTAITVGGAGTLRITGFAAGLAAPVTLADTVTLSVEGVATVGSSLLTVGAGATLGGDGAVGALAVNAGGTLAPGLSPGTLRAGATTLAAGGNYNFQIADAAGSAGFGWDLLDVTGALTVAATAADPFKVNLWSLSATNPDVNGAAANFDNQTGASWTFARGTSIAGFAADKFTVNTAAVNGTAGFTNSLAGGSFSVAASGTDLNVVFTPFVSGTSLDWYGDGTTAGGSGTWTSLGANWSPDSGVTVGTWDSARTAVFGGTGGTVTVQAAGVTAARGLDFRVDGYTVAGGAVTLGGATAADNAITVGSGATTTVSAPLAGASGMTKAGPGRLVLAAANAYSGGTTVAGGTLQVGDGTAGSLTGNVEIQTGGTLAFNAGAATSFAGAISGVGGLVKQGAGDLALSGASSHTGGTRVEAGSITANGFSTLGAGGVTAIDGAVYAAVGTTVPNAISVGEASNRTPVLLAGWDFQTTTTGGTAVAASPATPTSLTANFGTGTLKLDGTNGSSAWQQATQLDAFGGTTLNAGPGFSTVTSGAASLALKNQSANGQSAVFAVDMTGYSLLDVSYATQGTATGFTSQAWSVSTDGTTWQPVGTVANIPTAFAARSLPAINGLADAATAYVRLTVDGATSSTGNNRIDNVQFMATPGGSSGTVILGTQATSGTASFSGGITLNQGVTLTAPAGGRADFSGIIADGVGQNGLTKTGGGTVVLGGVNTYAGPTAVQAGTLVVNAANGPSAVTVAAATLGGTGTVGPLALGAGSVLAPGSVGPGTLAAGATTLAGGASYSFQIANASGTAGTAWDLLGVTGGLSVTATQAAPYTVNLWSVTSGDASGPAAGFDPLQAHRWTFLDTTTPLASLDLSGFAVNATATAATGGFANDTRGGTFSIGLSTAGTGLDVLFTPDPVASSLVWFGDDASAGGKGDWTGLNLNWSEGATLRTWDPAKTAIFGTVGGEVTIGPAGISAGNGLSFQATDYLLTGGTLTLAGGSALANTISVAAGFGATISAPVAGTAGLTKAGAGTLVLAADNTLTGGTTIAAGTLQLGAGGSAGRLEGGILVGAGATLAVDRADEVTLPGVISGTGGVAKRGAGTLVLTAANSYSGGTAVAEGTIVVGDGATAGGIAAAGTLDLAAASVLAFDRADAIAFTGAVTGSGTLSQRGTGTLTLSRPTAYGGAFTLRVEDGTVNLDRSGTTLVGILGAGNTVELAGGTLQLTSDSGEETKFEGAAINVQASSTLAINRASTTANNQSTTGFSAPITVANAATLAFDFRGQITTGFKGTTTYSAPVTLAANATFAVANSAGGTAEVIFSGAVGDGGAGNGLTKAGPQQLTLAGVNTYSGPTTVSAGTLALAATGTIATSPLVRVASAATLNVAAKTGGYAVPAGQTVAGAGSVVGSLAFASGATVAPGDAVGTLTTSGDVSFGGGGNYNWQVFDFGGSGGTAGGWDLLSVGGTLAVAATPQNPFAINLWSLSAVDPQTSGTASGFDPAQPGTWRIASAATGITGFAADAFTVNAVAANGTGGLANAFGAGTFRVAVAGNDLNLVYSPGGAVTGLTWYGNGAAAGGAGTWSAAGSNWFNGTATGPWDQTQPANFTATGGSVTIAAEGVSAAAGLTVASDGYTLTGGTLTLAGATAQANTIDVADTAVATIAAPLAGTAGLTKAGPGGLVLAASNTYTGGTTVAAGVLAVGDGGVAGSIGGDVTVAAGARLAFDRSDSATFAGGISGAGELEQLGSGTLVLAGAGSHTGGTTVFSGTLRVANANAVGSSPVTVESGATLSVASGTTMKTPSVTVNGGTVAAETLAVNGSTGVASLTINSGTIASTTAVVVGPGGLVDLPDAARLSVGVASLAVDQAAGGGKIDLGAGQVTIAAGGITAADLRADIIAGRSGGTWAGATGITSATAAATPGTRAVGYTVAGNGTARVSFAAPGDTNLDGLVNFSDIQAIINGGRYGQSGTTGVWGVGDFNYDGLVNFTDIQGMLNAGRYGQASYFPAAPLGGLSIGDLGGGSGSGGIAAVPEPSAVALVVIAAVALAAGHGYRRARRAAYTPPIAD
jgi:autotransporter-associated beta strand protein